MERRGGQYSVTNCLNVGAMLGCRCDVGLSVRCWVVGAMFPPSIFEDRCVDLRRSMIDVSTFEDRRSMCRPSKIDGVVSTFDDRCEIMLPHLLETLMV